jgi:hypothetical protein
MMRTAAALLAIAGLSGCRQEADPLAWYRLATAATISPLRAHPGDLVWRWTAPDGRTIVARIALPRPERTGDTVTVIPPPAGADARPVFEAAVATARARHAARIRIPPGTYRFLTTEPERHAHWLIQGLNDVAIEGTGATLVFTSNADGVAIRASRRVVLSGLTIDYALRTASLGRMVSQGGRPVIQLDQPPGPTDGIGHITEFDRTSGRAVPNGMRVYMPKATDVARTAAGAYRSARFEPTMIGRSFLVYHHYYGGVALKLQDDARSGAKQDEDIVIRNVTVRRSPGMGIVVYGVRRGVAIIDSRILPAPGEYASSEYDAIHVLQVGGDLAIVGNTIDRAGDDNINVGSPVTPIAAAGEQGRKLALGRYSRFIRPGDTLAAFDGHFRMLGLSRATDTPQPLGGLDHAVRIDRPFPGAVPGAFIRDAALSNGRVIIAGNTIRNGGDTLVQVGNVLVRNNRFERTGVRILASLGTFQEGSGGFNVTIAGNSFSGGRVRFVSGFPHAAITAYGLDAGDRISAMPVNRFLAISGNRIVAAPLGCISISSTSQATITGNACIARRQDDPASFDIQVINADQVTIRHNSIARDQGLRLSNVSGLMM